MLVEALKTNPYVLRAFISTVSLNVLASKIQNGEITAERNLRAENTSKVCRNKAALLLLEYYLITILTYTPQTVSYLWNS